MPVPHIEGWYIEPVARGQGLGRALIRSVEQWARTRGFFEIASDTQIENESSARAHEKCGFDEVERLVKFRKLLT
jgi:aminoglycoside 6'-N-acetyltransferase I